MKILVTGHSRSGTTLLRKLIRGHRYVKHMLHETMILTANRGRVGGNHFMYAWNGGEPIRFLFDSDNESWGEKILYDYPCIDYGVVDAFDYCLFWNELFGTDGCIINILRHPYDVIISSAKKRGVGVEAAANIYKKHMPITYYKIDGLSNAITIHFESLLFEPLRVLQRVFDLCGLDSGRACMKEAISKATPDIEGGRLNPSISYSHQSEYFKLEGLGIDRIANKLGYQA